MGLKTHERHSLEDLMDSKFGVLKRIMLKQCQKSKKNKINNKFKINLNIGLNLVGRRVILSGGLCLSHQNFWPPKLITDLAKLDCLKSFRNV